MLQLICSWSGESALHFGGSSGINEKQLDYNGKHRDNPDVNSKYRYVNTIIYSGRLSKPTDKSRSLILSGVWARSRHFGELVYRKAGIDQPSSIILLSGSEAPFQ